MTEISEAAKAKAHELFGTTCDRPLLRIQVATFIQQVSDAAKIVRNKRSGCNVCDAEADRLLTPFILPEPVDPLVVSLDNLRNVPRYDEMTGPEQADYLRAMLTKRGFEITPTGKAPK